MEVLRYIGYVALFFGRFVLFPVYWLSGFVRRRDDLWVFGCWGGHRFADNGAAFFVHCHRTLGDRVEILWISRDLTIVRRLRKHGLPAAWIWSPTGVRACLQAGFYIFDCFVKDINFWLSRGAKRINLWSGVPLKVFERDIDNPRNRYYRLFHGFPPERAFLAMMMPSHLVRPDLIIATSEETARITRRAFDLPEGRVAITGFPRNDVLFDRGRSVAELNCPLPDAFTAADRAGRTKFLYLPTFRDSGRPYMDMDWERLNATMDRLGATFFFKTHPMDRLKQGVHSEFIHELPQPIDVYDVLPATDVLISDYSSIIFDFMLVDRPIVYYTPDLNMFVESSRSFIFHPKDVAVGPMCESFEELVDALERTVRHGHGVSSERRDEVFARLHEFRDGRSAERVLAILDQRYFGGRLTGADASEIRII